MRSNCFCAFFILLIAWPFVSVAEDFKFIDAQKGAITQRSLNANHTDAKQSQISFFESGKSVEGDNKNHEENQLDTDHIISNSQLKMDVKESKPVGFVDLPEKMRQVQQGYNLQALDNSSMSSNFLFASKAVPDTSSSFVSSKVYPGDGYGFFDKLKEEVRDGVGDGIYTEMAWTYGEIKRVENLINSTMAQYGFSGDSLLGKQKYNVVGLDDRLNVMVLFQQADNASFFSESGRQKNWKAGESRDKTSAIEYYQNMLLSDQVRESKFVFLFKYLTIINLLYAFFIMIFIVIFVRVFKFLVRQQ